MRGEARYQAILKVAVDLVVREGAANITVAKIAREASASKETIYRRFKDRNGLLVAVLEHFADAEMQAFEDLVADSAGALAPADFLKGVGRWYLQFTTRAEVLTFYRYIVGHAQDIPALGKAYTAKVTEPVVAGIARYFEGQGDNAPRAEARAEAFLGLLQGKFWNRALVEPDFPILRAAIEAQVTLAVAVFTQHLGG